MFNWGVRQDKKAVNAIILGEGSEKGRPFKSRFLQAGLVKYDFGVCLLQKETIDKFIDTFKGCPVIINHKDNITESDKVGVVNNIWFSDKDGWYWCDGVLTDDKAVKLVESGYNVSCQYAIIDYSINNDGKLHNGNPYDKEILNGLFEHLAIVDNPRYEGAYIAVNAYVAQNAICRNEFKENEHPRDRGGKFCIKPNSNYSSYEDYETEFLPYIEEAPQDYEINNFEEALKDLGITETKPLKISNPYETVDVTSESIKHIVGGGGDGHEPDTSRYKSINKMLATLKDPNLITEDENGKKRYFKLFNDQNKVKRQFVILFDEKDIPTVYTTMPVNRDKKYFLNQVNAGKPVYKKGQTGVIKNSAANNIITDKQTDFNPNVTIKVINKYQPVFDWIRNFKGGTMDKETKGLFESLIEALKARNEADDDKKKEDDKKAENKKAKNEDVDKRKLIDEVAGIMKSAGADDELIRTAIAKMEKLAYDKSEAGTADNKAKNEDEEEGKDKDAENKCKNKCKNEDDGEKEEKEEKYEELKEEVKKEAENKKAKNSMDALKRVFFEGEAPRDKIYMSQKEGIELGKKLY